MDIDLEELKELVNDPPEQLRQVCFMYRQATARRKQCEGNLTRAKNEYQQSIGAEEAMMNTVIAMNKAMSDPDNVVKIPEGGQ